MIVLFFICSNFVSAYSLEAIGNIQVYRDKLHIFIFSDVNINYISIISNYISIINKFVLRGKLFPTLSETHIIETLRNLLEECKQRIYH